MNVAQIREMKRKKRLEILKAIDEKLALGESAEELSEQLLSVGRIKLNGGDASITRLNTKPHEGRKIILKNLDLIIEKRMEYESWKSIGIAIDLTHETIRDFFKKTENREMIKRDYPNAYEYVTWSGHIEGLKANHMRHQVIEMYKNKHLIKEISLAVGLSENVVSRILKEWRNGKNE